MTQKTRELLDRLLAGHQMTPGELDTLLNEQVGEDLYLEYKHGDWLGDKNQAPRAIRRYLSGFANSAGGVLIVGVNERTWEVTGCSAPGGGDLAEWAARCVNPIAPHFSVPPRFQVVVHPAGNVLLVSADRSLGLVHCIEPRSEPVYYFRLHDQTLKAPEYLISDLVLGRRQHPYLHITRCQLESFSQTVPTKPYYEADLTFQPSFTIDNEGLGWADDVRLGTISWNKHKHTEYSEYLLRHIQVYQPTTRRYAGDCVVSHFPSTTRTGLTLEPFTSKVVTIGSPHSIPVSRKGTFYTPYRWQAAVYLLPRGSPPVWYQLDLIVDTQVLEYANTHWSLSSDSDSLTIERMSGERPVVAWESIERP
jgi:hypothetical protein